MALRQPSLFLLLAAVGALAAAGCPSTTPPAKPKPTGAAWEGNLTVITGDWSKLKEIIDSHSSKVVVVNVWVTEIESGTREIHNLAKLQKQHGADIACIVACCDFGFGEEESLEDVRAKVEKILRKRFGKVLGKTEALTPTVTLFLSSDKDAETFNEAAGIEGPPTIMLYGKIGQETRQRIDVTYNSVQPPPPKPTKTDKEPDLPAEVTISYEKHVVPIVERLLKE